MASKRPNKRISIRAKTNTLSTMSQTNSSHNKSCNSLAAKIKKRDKRLKKRSVFLSNIEIPHKIDPKKCRRPSKKLVTSLSNLLDALPNDTQLSEGLTNENNKNKPRSNSLKIKLGVSKKRAKIEKEEKTRFDMNLVKILEVGQLKNFTDDQQLNISIDNTVKESSELGGLQLSSIATSSKFAAIRAWASANLDIHPSFK
ncbi:hypothetical protein HI914_04873 [Erysiphe necator]|uniref:Ribosome biogenesis protein SLX9 n=1 Tax=Uncinula necator TaxID=52586 RepID=A0A0B1P773_UNCNE|nr:hypothetical protein HI914_04873 [Erysiphe necator]KHJ32756.1 putative atp-dependent clp protease [Erysiphe necator]